MLEGNDMERGSVELGPSWGGLDDPEVVPGPGGTGVAPDPGGTGGAPDPGGTGVAPASAASA